MYADASQASSQIPKPPRLRSIGFLIAGLVGLFLSVLVSVRFGASNISYQDVLQALFRFDPDKSSHIIIRELRFPRALAAVSVGAALAVSGAIMQGMTKNPLASPSIMGVTAGSSFMIAVALAFTPTLSYSGLTLFAFLGAGIGVFLVFGVTSFSRGGITPVKLALAGSAITALLSSLSTAVGIRFNISKDISFFYAGGVSAIQPHHIYFALPFILAGLLVALALSPSITILSLGEDVATALGQNKTLVKWMGTLVVLFLTGAAVSIAGMVGFVGLVVPHIVRFLIGIDYRWVIPFSAVFGGILLVVADIMGRMVNPPFETPVGAVTAVIGVPFFLYLARKEGQGL